MKANFQSMRSTGSYEKTAVATAIGVLQSLEIVHEKTGLKKNRRYSYAAYIGLLTR